MSRGRPRKQTIEKEAQEFVKRKTKTASAKPLDTRVYLAGMALAGMLASGRNIRPEEIKREAYAWADLMLSED